MNIEEICKLIEVGRKNSVDRITMDGVCIDFDIGAPLIAAMPSDTLTDRPPMSHFASRVDFDEAAKTPPPYTTVRAEDILKPPSSLDNLSEEEILYAATPFFDELQAKKALHQDKINEEIKK